MASVRPRKVKGKLVKDKQGLTVFRAWIPRGKNADGSYDVETMTIHASTLREAEREAERIEAAGNTGMDVTFAGWAEQWLADQWKKNRYRTVAEYERMLRTKILPELGQYHLSELEPPHLAKFKHQLSMMRNERFPDRLLSAHSQHKYFKLVKEILAEAYVLGVIPVNPAVRVKAPTFEQHRAEYYQEADTRAMLAALAQEPLMWRAIITLSFSTGLRRGELVALQWHDVNFTQKYVHIHHGSYLVKGEGQRTDDTKNASSIRNAPVPQESLTLLNEWRLAQGGGNKDYVCAYKVNGRLRWMHIDTPTRWFSTFIKDHNLKYITLHGLRHTNATALIAAGLSIPEVSLLLGHSSPVTTARVYAHAAEGLFDRANSAISGLLSPKFSLNSENNTEK